ncbi:MAG: tRNA (adenosine(37)-N6)-dimethylallyltransferase MiaA, partial [Isosphaeraceae bacterium]
MTGPTGVGKTAVGVALAQRLGAEVVAMDSMSLYRGMDVGTAKPTIAERQGIPHHLIDRLDPWEAASVASYRDWAREAVEDVERRGKRVLFVGGTPLYLKALLRGMFDGPGADQEHRDRLEAEADCLGNQAMLDRLSKVDPSTAARLHPNDLRRIIRALEVIEATGRPISDWQREHDRPADGVTVIALTRPRDELRDRINRRVL